MTSHTGQEPPVLDVRNRPVFDSFYHREFPAIRAVVWALTGNVWTAERPLMLSLVPREEAGQFFGFMVLSARAAAIVGPVLWALAVDLLEPHFGTRIAYGVAVASVGLGFVGALVLLHGVPDRFEREAAAG